MAVPVKVYVDLLSQPCRAVSWFCNANSIPHTLNFIRLNKGEHRTPEYLKIHPFGKVPAIVANGYTLYESHSILRYLAEKYQVADHWYPRDFNKRLEIEKYLDWHHLGLRQPAARMVVLHVFAKALKKEVTEKELIEAEVDLKASLSLIESHWLKSKFIANNDNPSIADLSAVCELTQLRLIDVNYISYGTYPNIKEYIERMSKVAGFEGAHEALNKVVERRRNSNL